MADFGMNYQTYKQAMRDATAALHSGTIAEADRDRLFDEAQRAYDEANRAYAKLTGVGEEPWHNQHRGPK